jgi:lysophospholipase L1-like esterase
MNIASPLQITQAVFGILILGPLFSANSTVQAQDLTPKRYLMGAMGDSITAGFIANTHVHTLATDYVLNFPPFTHKTSDSWASGKSIASHYFQLEKSLEQSGDTTPVDVLNVADPGDVVHDMIGQAKQIKAAMDSGKYESLKYLVLFIGANDACAKKAPYGKTENKIRKSLQETFENPSRRDHSRSRGWTPKHSGSRAT